MKYVLYLSPSERQLWQKTPEGWVAATGTPTGHVWIVTDFPDESIAEITSPRLSSRDRRAFVERQLATRYPDTPYRGYLVPKHGASLLDRLMPRRHVTYAIESRGLLDSELGKGDLSCAGVWPISMLLASYGLQRVLPPDLFLVLPGDNVLRIVYLKNRTPVLTRSTNTPNEPRHQIDEVLRTVKYLENTGVLGRDQGARSVLYFGDEAPLKVLAEASKLALVAHPRGLHALHDWRLPLFEFVLRSPAGQVAPLQHRTSFVADRLRKAALIAAAGVLLLGVALSAGGLVSSLDANSQGNATSAALAEVSAQLSGIDEAIAAAKIDPDTVRAAVALHDSEISSVPAIHEHLRAVGAVVAADPNLRLKELQWRLLPAGRLPCEVTEERMAALIEQAPDNDISALRTVEVSFELNLPSTYGPRDRASTLRRLSSGLAALPEARIWRDALKNFSDGSLSGGGQKNLADKLDWCLTLPGALAPANASAEVSK
jgi:hypothetical protein